MVNYGNADQAQNANYPVPSPQNPNVFVMFTGAPFTDIGSPAIDDTGYAINFASLTVTKIAAITDGLSNTMMASEIKIVLPGTDLRGYTWWGPSASFTALLTPNSQLPGHHGQRRLRRTRRSSRATAASPTRTAASRRCTSRRASYHPGGVNVGFCDGSVRFFKNTVSLPTYQALSTTAGWRGPQLRLVLTRRPAPSRPGRRRGRCARSSARRVRDNARHPSAMGLTDAPEESPPPARRGVGPHGLGGRRVHERARACRQGPQGRRSRATSPSTATRSPRAGSSSSRSGPSRRPWPSARSRTGNSRSTDRAARPRASTGS